MTMLAMTIVAWLDHWTTYTHTKVQSAALYIISTWSIQGQSSGYSGPCTARSQGKHKHARYWIRHRETRILLTRSCVFCCLCVVLCLSFFLCFLLCFFLWVSCEISLASAPAVRGSFGCTFIDTTENAAWFWCARQWPWPWVGLHACAVRAQWASSQQGSWSLVRVRLFLYALWSKSALGRLYPDHTPGWWWVVFGYMPRRPHIPRVIWAVPRLFYIPLNRHLARKDSAMFGNLGYCDFRSGLWFSQP
jgi:hypothetical protein